MTTAAASTIRTQLRLDPAIDPLLTLRPLWRGPGDPQMAVRGTTIVRVTRTPAGPACLRLELGRGRVAAEAWGPGAPSAVEALPGLLGAVDSPLPIATAHPLLRQLLRRFAGFRMTRTNAVLETLVPTIIAQKVTGLEAGRSQRALWRSFGEPAPGPGAGLGLMVPPDPERLGRAGYHELHPLGIERRRAETIIAAARAWRQVEAGRSMPPSDARRRLEAIPGVGPWTSAETVRLALGDPDAVSVGDYNLPHLVGWVLAGEERATDQRMLELLEPYRGQRARVVQILALSGLRPPRYGPRLAPRMISGL